MFYSEDDGPFKQPRRSRDRSPPYKLTVSFNQYRRGREYSGTQTSWSLYSYGIRRIKNWQLADCDREPMPLQNRKKLPQSCPCCSQKVASSVSLPSLRPDPESFRLVAITAVKLTQNQRKILSKRRFFFSYVNCIVT